ncbi:hypothetical protein [Roseicella aerolata]|uniref:Membrane protein 6-pyruvoyl-tetrahydropterin synthase-related domain-containing protein n=1 Tax=Roseicella aerolata TaxID=2883479 RepID=A0A9X1IA61_9PROT|nr:hypothetical protein [Roseicella aerolata]MCB4820767.1 hypothetical protein [Roseicella aerolata]
MSAPHPGIQARQSGQAIGAIPAWLVVALAAALGPLLVAGLPGSFASSGQDVGAAMLWLHGMAESLGRGEVWPHWLADGNRGFGSPAFFFYPPGAYWIGSAVQATLGLDTGQALVATALLWRLAACALAYAWLRQQATHGAALAGAALFALQTYNMLVNPLVRFAFSEMAGTCALLLALIATGTRRPLLWVPPAFAALVLTHLPMAELAGGVLPAWAFVAAGAGRAALRRAAITLAGCLLGAGIAGAYLLPALLLLPEINQAGWDTGGLTTWSGHFLLEPVQPPKAPVQFWLMNAGLLIMIGSALALARGMARRDRRFAAGAVLFGLLCLLMTRLSSPVWALVPLLQRVQFPWRLMPFAVAVWTALVARRLDQPAVPDRWSGARIAALAALLLAGLALWIPYSAVTARLPAFARHDWTRLQIPPPGPRPRPLVNPPEYAPRAAALAGWRAEVPTTDAILQDRLARSRATAPDLRISTQPGGRLRVTGRLAAPSGVLLPQFAFPGWSLAGAPPGTALATDPGSGLLRLDLPAGAVDLAVFRTTTEAERIGWAVSATILLFWLLLLLLARRPRDPASPSPQQP